jgi:signal transduction histidine kinase
LSANYLPHRYCYLAQPGLIWTNVVMDGLIAASYGIIFGCLFWIASRLRNLSGLSSYLWVVIAFGSFILACGATHLMEMITVWWPVYRFSAAVKVLCAAASVPTAVFLVKATPALAGNTRRFIDMLSTTQREKEQAMHALIASEKLAVAGLISATISHEIKNPLQNASDLLYLLKQEPSFPAEVSARLDKAASELKRAVDIAQNTLSLFRTSTAPEFLDLADLVRGVLDLLEPDLARRNISLQVRLKAPRLLKAYPGELRQILINLIQNAAAAIGSNGRILVRVKPRHLFGEEHSSEARPGLLEATARSQSKPRLGYSITLADTGSGIDAIHRSRLFTLFFTTRGEKGTGLGLWLVRSMVEKQGGRIRLRSRTSAEARATGTIFNIWMPLDPTPIAGAEGHGNESPRFVA